MIGVFVLGPVLLACPYANAQNAEVLIGLGNQNDAQSRMAFSIDNVCPTIAGIEDDAGTAQDRLAAFCSNMVGNGGAVLGNDDLVDALGPGFGLDETGLNNALQAVNGEEILAAQSRIGEIRNEQNTNIGTRLSAIRSGLSSRGISLAALSLQADGQNYTPVDLALAQPDQLEIIPAAWLDDEHWSKLGIFVAGSITIGDKDDTGQSDGFDFNSLALTVGADYQVTDTFVAGGAIGFSRFESDVNETARSTDGEELDSLGYTLSLFASQSWETGTFIDGVVSYGNENYDSVRRIVIDSDNPDVDPIDETANGDFDAQHYGAAVNLGHQIQIDAWSVTPVARLEYTKADFDGFTEVGADFLNLTFDDFDAESLRSNIGFEATYSISTDQGVYLPALRAEYVHEFLNDDDGARVAYAADSTGLSQVTLVNEDVDRDYGIIGASITAQGTGGMSAFVDYSTFVALDDFDIHQIRAGVRWEF